MNDLHPDETTALTQRLIRCDSVTPREAGSLDLMQSYLEAIGFTCQRLPFGEGEARVDNLVARYGASGPHIGFAGHVDVVPVGDEAAWSVPPFSATIRDGHLIGRGAEDMKGAVAAFATACKRFLEKNKPAGRISLILTCDEEADAIHGTEPVLKALKQQGNIPDCCIVGEPTNPTEIGQMAKIGRRGSYGATITVHGKQGHVAYPQLADNPVPKLAAIVNEISTHVLDEGDSYFQASNLEVTSIDVGNKVGNVIPAHAVARLNVRFNTHQSGEKLESWLHSVCKKHAPNYELHGRASAQAFVCPLGQLAEVMKKAVQEISGRAPELSTTGGTSDARFIQAYCPVVEYGSTGRTSHMVDENVRVDDLITLSRTYERALELFFNS
ncbi:succinyl-diaminopimelate desuccinylase [bacterium]|nr:succinyl-diaminopimelate desuccinylase [bacterium]